MLGAVAARYPQVALAAGVGTWMFSELQFQVDMGFLLAFIFLANMVGAIILLPALVRLLIYPKHKAAQQKMAVELEAQAAAKE